jgi:hypothetical protein
MPAIAGRVVRVPAALDLLFAVTLAVEALGTGLGAYAWVGWPEGGSHLVIPFLSAPIVYQAFARLGAIPVADETSARRSTVGAGLVAAAGVLALGALWELVEWGADNVFGTDYSQGYDDTLSDLLADSIAAAGGGVLVAVWLRSALRGPFRRARPARAMPGAGRRRGQEAS